MRNYKKYDVWKLGHEITLDIYKVTKTFPKEEKFQIISQMQRAAYSIPSNIAEGCGRKSEKEFNRYLQIASGSAHELEYFSFLSKDLGYISDEMESELSSKIILVKKKLYRLSCQLNGGYGR